jgi:hypothetical protein
MAFAGYVFGAAIQYLVSRLEILLTVGVAIVIALIVAYRWFWGWTERQVCKSAVLEPVKVLSSPRDPSRPAQPPSRPQG